jgi:hypothetical protein
VIKLKALGCLCVKCGEAKSEKLSHRYGSVLSEYSRGTSVLDKSGFGLLRGRTSATIPKPAEELSAHLPARQ